jgi:FAD/FMN-containing dehydrogenase/Fe-S oxidoreductase
MATQTVDQDTRSLVEDLRRDIDGEIRADKMTRLLYSTDASIYQVEPIAVVLPKTTEDVIAVVTTADRHNIPILPRGGGTSLAGQTVNRAIVIDFSKYMRSVVELNAEEQWVRTQPGIILDELNTHIHDTGLMFAPNPSTSNRGNVGGALGNNSCGAQSIVWGKTVDNVEELSVVLANGETATFGELSAVALETKMREGGLEADIYRQLFSIGQANRDEVEKRYPKIQRRVSGYNLDEFVDRRDFDMARFVVGSEGTLVTITEAKLKLVARPKFKGLAVIHFKELIESMEATVAVLELAPSAVEHIGSMILRQAQANLEYSRMTDFIDGDPDSLLAVEFTGESESEVESKLDHCMEHMGRKRLGYSIKKLTSAGDQAKLWNVRKAGLGLMMNVPGDAKPLPFVEDTAVSPEQLPKFVKRFDEIVKAHGTEAGYYGHASVGCLHIRPLINLKREDGVEKMASIAEAVSDLVLEFGGSMSGEHGDGRARSPWHEKMFGPQIYDAFRQVKQAFDPKGIMNPGNIVDAPAITENLKISPTYRPLHVETGFGFTEEGSFAKAIEMCNGQGACRKLSGTMCPSYMVTRDEEHSTRGRANALRSAMSGALPVDSMTGKRLYDVLDLCLECKGCKGECPSNVDMAKLKYEFLYRYHKANGYPLRNRMLGNVSQLGKLGSFFAPLSNWTMKSSAVKGLIEDTVGIDRRRSMPTYASQTFSQWFRARGDARFNEQARGQVVLFPDTFTEYNYPNLGRAAVKVLEHLGYDVIVPKPVCCGRPMLSNGMLDKAKHNAAQNVSAVLPFIQGGAKLVGLEPSCILSFRDDYVDLLGSEAAKTVSKNTMLIEEFVLHAQDNDGATLEYAGEPGRIVFHGHCHQKALVGTSAAMQVLSQIPGCDPTEIQSGCCGMAGSFGMEKEHYDVSMKIGEQSLFGPIRDQQGEFTVVSEGMSCRHQIDDGTGVEAKHLVEVLADAL